MTNKPEQDGESGNTIEISDMKYHIFEVRVPPAGHSLSLPSPWAEEGPEAQTGPVSLATAGRARARTQSQASRSGRAGLHFLWRLKWAWGDPDCSGGLQLREREQGAQGTGAEAWAGSLPGACVPPSRSLWRQSECSGLLLV